MYALLLVDPFSGLGGDLQPLMTVEKLENTKMPTEGVTKILPCAWLIDLNKKLSALRKLLDYADDSKLRYSVTFLEKEPIFSTYRIST